MERGERPWREAERRFVSGGRARRRLLALRLDNHARTSGGDVAREDVSARRRKSTRRLGVIDMATAWRQTQRQFVVGIRAQGRPLAVRLDIREGLCPHSRARTIPNQDGRSQSRRPTCWVGSERVEWPRREAEQRFVLDRCPQGRSLAVRLDCCSRQNAWYVPPQDGRTPSR